MRIFDYLNVSNEREIWADSGYHVQRNLITEILKKRNDYHFYLTVPYNQMENAKFTDSELVTLLPYNYSGGSGNKYHFDTNQLWKHMDMWHKDWDLVLNNEVILGNHFRNMFCYKSHFDIPVINYVHWVNTTEEDTAQQHDMLNSILWCHKTCCNSEYGRSLITKNVDKVYQKEFADKIRSKILPLNVGFNHEELEKYKTKDKYSKTTLIFNHRISQYTGYDKLIEKCKKIYDSGTKDFQLIFTNPSVSLTRRDLTKYPFLRVLKKVPSYPEYIKMLWKSDICFGLHNGQNQWSIAFLEAFYCDNLPITTNDFFFPEMFPTNMRDGKIMKTETLDDLQDVIENHKRMKYLWKEKLLEFSWSNLAQRYIDMIESSVSDYEKNADNLLKPNDSKVFNDIKTFLKVKPIIDKQEILSMRSKKVGSGIGAQTPYTKYRRELLKICDDDIESEISRYRLKDMSKANVKPIDWWLS